MLERSVKKNSPRPSLPAGYTLIPVKTTYLEMQADPVSEPPAPPAGCVVEQWHQPGLEHHAN